MSSSTQSCRALNHFHVCVHCGSAFRREEFESRALTSGIYPCPSCGLDGPLNVVVRNVDDRAHKNHQASDSDSAN